MDKFTIFRELLDYVAHCAKVTDANMNNHDFYKDRETLLVAGETEGETITIEVTIMKKEVKKDAEELE